MFNIFKINNSLKISNFKFRIIKLSSICLFAYLLIYLFIVPWAYAGPTSSSFELQQYGFGAGGVASSSSDSFLFQGILGEMETASLSSSSYLAQPGLTYTLEPNTPGAPTFTNPSNYYNKLHIIIDNANNPTDTTFAIQISSGSATFTSNIYYLQADTTPGASPVWQTYASWGSATGVDIIGLLPGTTYYARVAAKSGDFQQGIYGPSANASTIIPTLTFNLETSSDPTPPFTVNIGNLSAGSVTTSTDTVNNTISTNATNGALIYLYGTNNGLKSTTAGNYNIASSSINLSAVPEGYGARGTSISQTSGGPMQLVAPYNGSSSNVGIIDTTKRQFSDSTNSPVTNGQVNFELKAKASSTTPSANDYTDVITVVATGSF